QDYVKCSYWKVPVDGCPLGYVGHVAAVPAVWFAMYVHVAGSGVHQSEDCLDECALARTVGAYDRGQYPWGYVKVDVPEDRVAPVADGQVLYVDCQIWFVNHSWRHLFSQSASS